MRQSRIILPDGRYLIYYRFDDEENGNIQPEGCEPESTGQESTKSDEETE